MGYTAPTTRATGYFVTAANWNTDLVDNITFLANPPTVRAGRATTQSINTSSETAVAWTSEDWDSTGAMHDLVTNNDRLIAPVAGKYWVEVHIEWQSSSTGRRIINVYKNVGIVQSDHRVSTNESAMGLTFPVSMAANDYVQARVFQDSGGALTIATVSRMSLTMFSQ